jgi:hypothetical protein
MIVRRKICGETNTRGPVSLADETAGLQLKKEVG